MPAPRGAASDAIAARLRARLGGHDLPPGARLPSEPALAAQLGTSRATLREALRVLQEERLIVRRHGAGTFVAERLPMANSLHRNFGVEQLIRSTGHRPGTREARWYEAGADEDAAQALGLEVGSPIFVLDRVRTSDGRPVVHSIDHLPAAVVDDAGPPLAGSLYEYLADACGRRVSYAEAKLVPELAPASTAERLGIGVDEPCLTIRQIDYDEQGRPVVWSIEHHLASAFEFAVLRSGPHADNPR